MSDTPALPPFAQAAEWLRKQLAEQGYPGDVRWIYREDVIFEGKRLLVRLPSGGEKSWAATNQTATELRYEYGRRRGLGARIDLVCMLGKNACCSVWLPRDENMAEFAQIKPGALKIRVPASKPPEAVGVSGEFLFGLYAWMYGPANSLGIKGRLPLRRRNNFETERIENLTLRFRVSVDPLMARMRALALEKGLVPDETVVAEWLDDKGGLEYGIFVSADKKVFQFVLSRGNGGPEDATFSEWRDLTDAYAMTPLGPKVKRALELAPLSEKEPWDGMFTEA